MLHKFKILTPLAMIICLLMMLNITPSFANEAEPASCKTLGDSNGDGEVDYLDAMLILQYHTGVIGEDDLILSRIDVDGSGDADYLDAMLVLQYHTGIIDKLPAAIGHSETIVPGKAATCREDGLTDGKKCSVCGETIVAQVKIDKLGHTVVIDAAAEPTCSKTGYTEGSHCSTCGVVLIPQQTIDATGQHTFVDGTCTVCYQDYLRETLYLEDLNQLMLPLFAGNTVQNETVMFLDKGDVKSLLYPIQSIQSVTSYDGTIVYEEGRDYVIENGNIKVTENSDIPCITSDYFYNFPNSAFLAQRPDGTLSHVYYGDGDLMTRWQVNVNYTHSNTWDGFAQTSYFETYQNFLKKLQSGEDVTIIFSGDSITYGATASGCMELAPYQPSYSLLFTQALADLFDYKVHYVNTQLGNTSRVPDEDYVAGTRGTITYVNTAVGGWTSADGVANLESYILNQVKTYGCDLLILAYGMNDGFVLPKKTVGNIQTMSEAVLQARPEASLMFVSTMVPNPNASIHWYNTQGLQEKPLMSLAENYRDKEIACSVACMTSVSLDILKHKAFEDYSGNNINHPNDFFSRIYAQTLLQTLIGYENISSLTA